MIERMTIANEATFGSTPEVLDELSQINFIFGPNGTGKTTISRLIAASPQSGHTWLDWKDGRELRTVVYNRDFVERSFEQSVDIPGVFTMGEHHVGAGREIASLRVELDKFRNKIDSITRQLDGNGEEPGKKAELADLETWFEAKCWTVKQKFDTEFHLAFGGVRTSKAKFKGRVLDESRTNKEELLALDELRRKASAVFADDLVIQPQVAAIDFTPVFPHENDPVLHKPVIGKGDVDVAAMINKLGSSDWVRAGIRFLEVSQDVCPFCQQSTTSDLMERLNRYFDETYESEMKVIDGLISTYNAASQDILRELESMLASRHSLLDMDALEKEYERLKALITVNTKRLEEKRREPSRIVQLESHSGVNEAIGLLIGRANAKVADHNKLVENIGRERAQLINQIWKYLLEKELKPEYQEYKGKRTVLQKEIDGRNERRQKLVELCDVKEKEIRGIENRITSIQPTINHINSLLRSFGFQGFSLARADRDQRYKLVRPDGTDAKSTLSEGEKTFVTFLYFYHLLKGSESATGITDDRVVVFDDPISSLDSDVLFIVSSLIRELLGDVRTGNGLIKQVFVLTHNVYFHKEVTYHRGRKNDAKLSGETFWILTKRDQLSRVEAHASNPIKTSYELLWAELRSSDRNNLTIQNTLRRILENYFKFFGGMDLDDLCGNFSGQERIVCNSLLSWVHDGSHHVHDDLYAPISDVMVGLYMTVFRRIFEVTGHDAHYRMMMADAYVEELEEVTA